VYLLTSRKTTSILRTLFHYRRRGLIKGVWWLILLNCPLKRGLPYLRAHFYTEEGMALEKRGWLMFSYMYILDSLYLKLYKLFTEDAHKIHSLICKLLCVYIEEGIALLIMELLYRYMYILDNLHLKLYEL
jgi:hypothetical protein